MGVRKRDNRWWVDFCFGRTRYRKRSPENSRAGALAYEVVMKQRLARGEPVDGKAEKKPVLYKDFARDWFETYVKNNNKHSEILNKDKILRVHLLPYFGRMELERICNMDVERYKAKKIEAGLHPKTINNQLAVLRKSLHTAVEWEAVKSCPVIKKLNVPPQKFDYLSEEECRLLIDAASGIWRDMLITALGTGLRFGELTALTWDDVDFTNRELTIRQAFACGVLGSTKSNRIRRIPMTASVYETLYRTRERCGYVFTYSNGKPVNQYTSITRLHGFCGMAGIRRVGWHVLRHTFASHLAQAGANLVAVQNLLGHSDIRTTMRYAHINRAVLREAIDTLNGNTNTPNFCHDSVTGSSSQVNDKIGGLHFLACTKEKRAKALVSIQYRQGDSNPTGLNFIPACFKPLMA
jgi:integrase